MPDHDGGAGPAAEEISDDDMMSHQSDAGSGNDEGVDAEAGGRQALTRDDLYKRLDAVDDPDAEEGEPPAENEVPQQTDKADKPVEDEPPVENEPPAPDAEEAEADDQIPDDEEPIEELVIEEEPEEEPEPEIDSKLLGRVPQDEWNKLPKVTKDRINALRADRKQHRSRLAEVEGREGLASYAEQIIRFADEHKIGDSDLQTWLEAGAVVQQGGEAAISELLTMARAFGWEPETAPPPPPGDAPLPDWLQAKVDAFEIDEATARDVARRMAPDPKAPEAPTPQRSERPRAPRYGPSDDQVAKGHEIIAGRIESAERRFGSSWAKIWPLVERGMLAKKGASPDAWGDIFDAEVEKVVARHKPRRPTRVGRTGLGPTSKKHEQVDAEQLKGRDRLYHKYTGRGS